MLPKRSRLAVGREIKETLKEKQYSGGGPLLSFVARDNSRRGSRVTIVVPRGIGNAVARNRARRVFAAAFSKISDNLAKNVDIVLYPKRSALDCKMGVIADELLRVLRKGIR